MIQCQDPSMLGGKVSPQSVASVLIRHCVRSNCPPLPSTVSREGGMHGYKEPQAHPDVVKMVVVVMVVAMEAMRNKLPTSFSLMLVLWKLTAADLLMPRE